MLQFWKVWWMFEVVISTGDGEDMPSLLFKIVFLHTPALGEPVANLALCFREQCWTQKKYQNHERITGRILFLIPRCRHTCKKITVPTLPTMLRTHQQFGWSCDWEWRFDKVEILFKFLLTQVALPLLLKKGSVGFPPAWRAWPHSSTSTEFTSSWTEWNVWVQATANQ